LGDEELDQSQRHQLNEAIVTWYYEEAGAMYLSFNSTRDLNLARQVLCDTQKTTLEVKDAFSALRTTIKSDCHIYTEDEKAMQLPQPPRRNCL